MYEVIAEYNNMQGMSLGDLKTVANQKMNPLQRIIKALSDVFVDIMPGILAAACWGTWTSSRATQPSTESTP